MPRNSKRKYRQVIDYIEDEVGVDIPRDVKKTAIESIGGSAQEDGVPINIEKIAGVDQSGANLLAALQSVSDNDELRIAIETDNEGILKTQDQPLDVSDAEVDVDLASQTLTPLTVTDDGSLNVAGVVSVQEDTALDVSATTVPTDPNTSDSASLNAATLAADGELVMSLSASGADSLLGQVRSSGSFNVVVRWKNSSGTVIREETIKNNTSGGSWADINQPAKSAEADIAVTDTSSAEQTVDATVHTG